MKRKPLLAVLVALIAIALKLVLGGGNETAGLPAVDSTSGASVAERATEPPSGGAPARTASRTTELAVSAPELYAAIRARRSGEWVEGSARVTKLLADDDEGARHQRFLAELDDGSRLLFAHNVDVARRAPVEPGDVVRFRGRYEWNDKGGVVHWTHRDERDPTRGGWLELAGETYR
jgi:hypothetical protein